MKQYIAVVMKSTGTIESIQIYAKGNCTLKYVRHWLISFGYKLIKHFKYA